MIEYVEHLHENFVDPVVIKQASVSSVGLPR
jgi:hypothetical protein